MVFDFQKISSILVCPRSKRELVLDGTFLVSTSPETRLRFPVVEDIPRLLVDEAEQLTPEVWGDIMQKAGRDPLTGLIAG
jgi:uncharacterized protein